MTTFTKMISVISTDPIDLHILPEQIDATMSNINIIQCLPTEGSISVDEFSFKRQMKDNQEKTAVKIQNDKKAKKKKRKGANASKLALPNIPDQVSSVNKNNVVIANHEDNPVSDEMVNERIEQFSQMLADFLVAGELTPEWNSLKYLFGLKDDPTTSDESFAFVQNPPANLLTYALHIKQRNEFIDEQIVPCSVDEFLSLLNRSNSIFVRHSSGLYSLIKEISSKIKRPAKQQLNVGRFVTSSDLSSFDSEQSEISSQVSSVGVTSLSQQLLETMINDGDEKNISGRIVKKNNAYSWSKKFSGSFNLAEEFSNAMMNYGKEEYLSSSKQSASVDTFKPLLQSDFQNTAKKFEIMSPKQFYNNYRRLNSDVENNKYPKDTDSEMRQSKRVCNEIEHSHRSVNAFKDSVAANIGSRSTFEEHEISPNQSSKNLNRSNVPSEDETQLDKSVNERIQANEAECTQTLSDQFSHVVDNSTLENGPRNSSKITWTSSTDFSASRNNSNSISTKAQLTNMKSETYNKAKHISRDFNLSDQYLNTVCTSLVEANFQNPLKSSKTSPLRSPNNFNCSDQCSNGTQSRNENSEKQVSNNYSSGNISLSDQFLASVNNSEYDRGKLTFDLERQTQCNVLKDSKNSLTADGLTQNLFCKTDAHSFKIVPKVADQKLLAVLEKNTENISKPMTENYTLSDQFLGAFESKKRLEITSNILDSSDQRLAAVNHFSGNIIPASIPNIEEVSGRSFSLVSKSKSQSNCISITNRKKKPKSTSHLTPEVTFKPESSLKSILVPEIESKSNISAIVKMNNSCNPITVMKNPNSLSFSDNEANKESSLLISNLKQKLNLNFEVPSDLKSNQVEFANCRSQYLTEHSKNYVKTSTTNQAENRLAQRFTSDCRVVRDKTCDGNVTNTVHKPSFGNVHQSENFKPSNNTVPVSSKYVAPGSKALDTDFINCRDNTDRLNLLRDNQTDVTLPSLRSHVSSQQEQKIWQHHFAFIRRQSVSRSRVTASQRQ